MKLHKPMHPGELIREVHLPNTSLSQRAIANALGVAPITFNRLINEKINLSPTMAHRLSRVLVGSPEMWMHLQTAFDLWHAGKDTSLKKLKPITFDLDLDNDDEAA